MFLTCRDGQHMRRLTISAVWLLGGLRLQLKCLFSSWFYRTTSGETKPRTASHRHPVFQRRNAERPAVPHLFFHAWRVADMNTRKVGRRNQDSAFEENNKWLLRNKSVAELLERRKDTCKQMNMRNILSRLPKKLNIYIQSNWLTNNKDLQLNSYVDITGH